MATTPISQWLDAYEEVTLPSGKIVGLRQVDVLAILTKDGRIPNVLMPVIDGYLMTKSKSEPKQTSPEDLLVLTDLLNKLARACFAMPAIVDTREEMLEGKGITVELISLNDKMSLIAWSLGGQGAVSAAERFLSEQEISLATLQSEPGLQDKTE